MLPDRFVGRGDVGKKKSGLLTPSSNTTPDGSFYSTERLAALTRQLAGRLPAEASAIVGLPRSGMIAASLLATQLHLPLMALTPSGLTHLTWNGRSTLLHQGAGPLVVVDDSVWFGNSLRRARKLLTNRKIVTAAVFVRREAIRYVDFFAEVVEDHFWEWNLFNCLRIKQIASDLDGVLVNEANGGPLWLPRVHALPLIVTGRRELLRSTTEDWLMQYGVKYGKLVMAPNSHRDSMKNNAEHKARHYADSSCQLFVESDPRQARLIFELTGRAVLCASTQEVWRPSMRSAHLPCLELPECPFTPPRGAAALTVATACSRPENLASIFRSLLPGRKLFDLRWQIVFDASAPPFLKAPSWVQVSASPGGVFGREQYNSALDKITEGWVWFCDDDNLAHPAFFSKFASALERHPEKRGFLFDQELPHSLIRRCDNVRVSHIDQAQYVLRRDLIDKQRFRQSYTGDGEFIERLCADYPKEIQSIREIAVYYNGLDWKVARKMGGGSRQLL